MDSKGITSMDLSQAINQPLAVVLILVVVFGFAMQGIDKLFYFIKTVTKKTPMDKMADSYERMVDAMKETSEHMDRNTAVLQKLTESIRSMNDRMEHNEEMTQLRHDQMIREVGRK